MWVKDKEIKIGVKFVYKGESNYSMVVKEFKDLPVKIFLSLHQNKIFIFYLKFDEKDHPYILVEESKFFKENIKDKGEKEESIGLEMYNSSIKDILKVLKKHLIKNFL